ncbi:hypothetical protein [Limnohabitans sp. Bal53]|uniref:hypothetical protein n=1 Tax=Limnohabitans sp. Bal53 TaxID=1977910 RepID=UPI0013049C8F|nr:hypothetical protein [Limnohabitans sp. Bal53]
MLSTLRRHLAKVCKLVFAASLACKVSRDEFARPSRLIGDSIPWVFNEIDQFSTPINTTGSIRATAPNQFMCCGKHQPSNFGITLNLQTNF